MLISQHVMIDHIYALYLIEQKKTQLNKLKNNQLCLEKYY